MKKILITDFFGTLISSDIEQAEYKCGYGDLLDTSDRITNILKDEKYSSKILDKMFVLLDRELKDYLEDGNIIKIVTSDGGHCEGIDWFIEQVLTRFNSLKEYKNQIEVYFCDIKRDCCNFTLNKVDIYTEKGCKYFLYNGIKFGILDKKEDIFDILQTIDLNRNELYALGNEYDDFPMLTKCMMLGGKSALIKENLYRPKIYLSRTTHSFICGKADMDYWLMIEDLIVKEVSDRNILNDYKVLRKIGKDICNKIPYEEWTKSRIIELYESLREQELDIQRVIEETTIYEIARLHMDVEYRTYHEKKLNELRLYPSFRAFKTNELDDSLTNLNKTYIKN